MDSYALKFTWKVELWHILGIDKNYRLAIEWSVVNESISPNHDWTLSKTYSFKPVHVLIHDELWDTIKAKDPRSESQKLRALLKYKWDTWICWTQYKEFDDFYASVYRKIHEQIDFLTS